MHHLSQPSRQIPNCLFYPLYVVKLLVLGVVRKGIRLIDVLELNLVNLMAFWLINQCMKIQNTDGVAARPGITLFSDYDCGDHGTRCLSPFMTSKIEQSGSLWPYLTR